MKHIAGKTVSLRVGGATDPISVRLREWLGALLAFALLLAAALGAAEARAESAAERFVAESIGKGAGILNDAGLSEEERKKRFHDFLLSITDVRRIALFTLGPYARGAAESEIEDFVERFTAFVTGIYQRGLEHYDGQMIRVTGSVERAADDAIVNADVLDREGKAAPRKIAFRVRKDDTGRHLITDLQVEGAWLALSQRADFMSYLQRHRGEIGELSRALAIRTERIRFGGGAPAPES